MTRRTIKRITGRDDGQALPMFALFLFVFLGFVAMSVDVGRFVWARTQMQAAVDAAALAAAQSMPDQPGASAKATEYWNLNNGFLMSQGENVQFTVSYPAGNKAISVSASADIPTWFAKLFGVPKWHVAASGDAESQVLDIAVVLDVSGSMCFTSYPPVETYSIVVMSPGRLVKSGGFAFPKITTTIPAGGASSIVIQLNDVRVFTSASAATNNANFGSAFNSTTPYWQRTQGSGSNLLRPGIIKIDNELFQITAVNTPANQLTVTRAQQNKDNGVWTTKDLHTVNAPLGIFPEVWANRGSTNYCDIAAYYAASLTTNGPHQPFDDMINDAQYFTTLFNSSYDKIGLADYSSKGNVLQSLTSSFSAVTSSMNGVFYPNGGTNIAHGLAVGRQILDGTGKRANAVRVLVLLTDGVPNQRCGGATYTSSNYNSTTCSGPNGDSTPTSCPATSTASIVHAQQEAMRAQAGQIIVFTIGLGGGVLDCILDDLAVKGGGMYFKAPTTAELDDAFQAIAEQTHIALVK